MKARMSSCGWVMGALLLTSLLPAQAHAKGNLYTDTQKRFSLTMPQGWKLYPSPGESAGMTFRRDVDGTFAMMRVTVRPAEPGESSNSILAQSLRPFQQEIGYQAGANLPTSVGLLPARKASFTVFASGDSNTVRSIELVALAAFGHVHLLHFEHLQKDTKRFRRDLKAFLGSYQAIVGRKVYGTLIGNWQSLDGGPDLVLGEDNRFQLKPLKGTFSATASRLTLHLDDGAERYRYKVEGKDLTLLSTNLPEPARYRRSAKARFATRESQKQKAGAVRSKDLIGKWGALDSPAVDPLVLHLAASGSVSFGPLAGRWRFRRGLLTIRSVSGTSVTYTASLQDELLILGGGDLDQELRLRRQ